MTARKPPSTRVTVRIDRALRRKWNEAMAVVRRTARGVAGAFDERWETVAEILEHDPPLYLAGGYASAREFLRAEVGETERTALRSVRVAKYASPAEEARYGVAKLDAVLAYLEARTGPLRGRLPVDFSKLRIAVPQGDRVRRLGVADASVAEIRAAGRALRREAQRTPPRDSPVVRAIAAVLRAKPLCDVRVRLAAGKLSFSAVPLAALADFGRALAAAKLPAATS
jgi:hypothetical protein